jgi:hypothetical protein
MKKFFRGFAVLGVASLLAGANGCSETGKGKGAISPGKGALVSVRTDPPGADVSSAVDHCISPCSLVAPKGTRLTIHMSGYADVTREGLKDGEQLDIALIPTGGLAPRGTGFINAAPPPPPVASGSAGAPDAPAPPALRVFAQSGFTTVALGDTYVIPATRKTGMAFMPTPADKSVSVTGKCTGIEVRGGQPVAVARACQDASYGTPVPVEVRANGASYKFYVEFAQK